MADEEREPTQLELFDDLERRPSSPTRETISRWAEAHDVTLIFFDPPAHFDHAILGLVRGFGQEWAVVYDEATVLAAMVADGMTQEDAEEWFEFNTIGAYVGEATPRFVIRPWQWEQEVLNVEET